MSGRRASTDRHCGRRRCRPRLAVPARCRSPRPCPSHAPPRYRPPRHSLRTPVAFAPRAGRRRCAPPRSNTSVPPRRPSRTPRLRARRAPRGEHWTSATHADVTRSASVCLSEQRPVARVAAAWSSAQPSMIFATAAAICADNRGRRPAHALRSRVANSSSSERRGRTPRPRRRPAISHDAAGEIGDKPTIFAARGRGRLRAGPRAGEQLGRSGLRRRHGGSSPAVSPAKTPPPPPFRPGGKTAFPYAGRDADVSRRARSAGSAPTFRSRLLVEQPALRGPVPCPTDRRRRVEGRPTRRRDAGAGRSCQVGIDERSQPSFAAQHPADAVAEVGRSRDATAATSPPRRPRRAAGSSRSPAPRTRSCRDEAIVDGAVVERPWSICRDHGGARWPRRIRTGRRRRRQSPGTGTASRRMRSAVQRATSMSPASSDDSTSCTFFPGRVKRERTTSGASGTGRSSSIVSRATNVRAPSSKRSAAREQCGRRRRRAARQASTVRVQVGGNRSGRRPACRSRPTSRAPVAVGAR